MGITGVVGSYTTTYGGTEGRVHNVRLVAELIDGALVAPGARFSFNQTTGERNESKGFEEAPVIINAASCRTGSAAVSARSPRRSSTWRSMPGSRSNGEATTLSTSATIRSAGTRP